MPGRRCFAALAVVSTWVPPMRRHDGALALRREPAGLEGERLVGSRNRTGDANWVSHEWLLSDDGTLPSPLLERPGRFPVGDPADLQPLDSGRTRDGQPATNSLPLVVQNADLPHSGDEVYRPIDRDRWNRGAAPCEARDDTDRSTRVGQRSRCWIASPTRRGLDRRRSRRRSSDARLAAPLAPAAESHDRRPDPMHAPTSMKSWRGTGRLMRNPCISAHPMPAEHGDRLGVLDALGDGAQAEIAREVDRGEHDGSGALVDWPGGR